MERNSRALSKATLPALMLLLIGPVACVALDKPASVAACAETKGGCQNNASPDTGRAESGPVSPDAGPVVDTAGPIDQAVADTAVSTGPEARDASIDSSTGTAETGGAVDGAIDTPQATPDAASPTDAPVDATSGGFDGIDTLPRPDTADAAAIEAGRTPDLGGLDNGAQLDSSAPTDAVINTATVKFSAGLANGPMTGYGWVTVGVADSITNPTCGDNLITSTIPCATHPSWNSSSALCVTGSVPALSDAPTPTEYAENWGLAVGVNAKEPIAAMGKAYTTIAINYSGLPTSGLRAEIHRSGDPSGTTYCAFLTSIAPVLLSSFNTMCWEAVSGTPFDAADAAKIDKVSIQVSSTKVAITVTNLCLNSIVFGS
jgi:hypothetical protein